MHAHTDTVYKKASQITKIVLIFLKAFTALRLNSGCNGQISFGFTL